MPDRVPRLASSGRRDYAFFKTMWFVPSLPVAFAFCLVPLAIGPETILLFELPGGLPLGTLIAALTLVLGAAVSLAASRPRSLLRMVSVVALVAASLWLPVGIWLAANAALNFVNDAANSAVFWRFTKGLAWLVLATMLWAGTEAINKRGLRADATGRS